MALPPGLFFLAFSQCSAEKTGKASFSEDNGGKSHSKNTGQQLRGPVSKDAVPLPCMSPCSPAAVSNQRGRQERKSEQERVHLSHCGSIDICSGLRPHGPDKTVTHHLKRKLECVVLAH